MAAEVNVRVNVTGAEQAEQQLDNVGKAGAKAAGSTDAAFAGLDRASGGLITRMRGVRSVIGNVAKGMKTLRGAIISTGIGALIVALGSLYSWMSQTVEGGGELEKTMGGISGAMEPLKKRAAEAGKSLFEAIKDPSIAWEGFRSSLVSAWNTLKGIATFIKKALIVRFAEMQQATIRMRISFMEFTGASEAELKAMNLVLEASEVALADLKKEAVKAGVEAVQPFIEAGNAVKEFFNEMGDAYDQGKLLAEQSIALRHAQRDLKVAFAQGRAEIKEYNMVAEDTTKSVEERIEAAEKAMAIEQRLMAQRQHVAAEELRIFKARDAMGNTDEEALEKIADLEANLINIRTESAELQTTLQNKLNTIRQQATAAAEAEIKAAEEKEKAEQEALDAQFERLQELEIALADAQTAEVVAVGQKYDHLLELAAEFGYNEQELIDKQNAEIAAINEKYRKEEEAKVKASEEAKAKTKAASIKAGFDLAKAGLELLTALNENDEEQNEQRAKAAFKRGKAIQMAGAVMATAQAVIAALAAPPVGLGFPAGLPGAVTAGITGAAQIATIAKQKFPGGGGGGVTAETVSGPVSTAALVPDTFAPGATSPTTEPEITASPMRAYVVSRDMTQQQEIDTELAHRATL